MASKKVFGVAKRIDKETLERMKRSGMTEFEIAAKFGCNRSHVTRASIHFGLQGIGAKRGHGTVKLKPIEKRELATLRSKGWKLHEIAEHFGCGVDHISVLIRKYDLPKSKAGDQADRCAARNWGANPKAYKLSACDVAIQKHWTEPLVPNQSEGLVVIC